MVATRRRQPVRSRADGGYSLPELLVVILILGILAAISTALYLSQRQRGYEAQLTADLRNAVVQVESDAAMNGGAYPSEAPAFTTSDATVSLVYAASGDGNAYCVEARHTRLPASRHRAHLVLGGDVERLPACPAF
jgi:prepilin-type N-terminal cleavage/methylation domain-containing protein